MIYFKLFYTKCVHFLVENFRSIWLSYFWIIGHAPVPSRMRGNFRSPGGYSFCNENCDSVERYACGTKVKEKWFGVPTAILLKTNFVLTY